MADELSFVAIAQFTLIGQLVDLACIVQKGAEALEDNTPLGIPEWQEKKLLDRWMKDEAAETELQSTQVGFAW